MTFHYDRHTLANPDQALALEWIETNGLGGWASSTLLGVNTRRYHGLLVAALKPPVARAVLVSRLDETLVIDGRRHTLGCSEMHDGSIAPHPGKHLVAFEKKWFPSMTYEVDGYRLRKTIVACHGQNTTLVLYEALTHDPRTVTLELDTLVAGRDYHYEARADDNATKPASFHDGQLRIETGPGTAEAYVLVPGSTFKKTPMWVRGLLHRVEKYRGLGHLEDLFRVGAFRVDLPPGGRLGVILSTEFRIGTDAWTLKELEQRRREALVEDCRDETEQALFLAADQFIVSRGSGLKTAIAGYHWFTDWGRDTMIALPGLCLSTGRHDIARKILQAFADHISEGMIPNRFPDAGDQPDYNTVDATLWMFNALDQYVKHSGDQAFLRECYPAMRDIIQWHKRGTRYNIRMEPDGLLSAGLHGTQLTWMDAKVGDWVVTPRHGKAVEINALWHSALRIMAEWTDLLEGGEQGGQFRLMAEQTRRAFNEQFWNPARNCCFDCIDGDRKDSLLRPNQLIAISLPHSPLPREKAICVLRAVEEKLLTPTGLRSLAPDESPYRGWYGGDQVSRDGAYHQGTVWSWLAGPYITALFNLLPRDEARRRADPLIQGLTRHLASGGAVGSISEIFDGDSPHTPRGCIAQAWSVAEFLRVYREFRLA